MTKERLERVKQRGWEDEKTMLENVAFQLGPKGAPPICLPGLSTWQAHAGLPRCESLSSGAVDLPHPRQHFPLLQSSEHFLPSFVICHPVHVVLQNEIIR